MGKRRRAPAPALILALLAPLVVMVAVLVLARSAASKGEAAPKPGRVPDGPVASTPVLSARRAPEPLVIAARGTRLASSLKKVTDAVQKSACLQVAVNGRVVVSDNAASVFIPASNQKILVASVALAVLGPDYRFVTEVRGNIAQDGSVSRLVLVGGGDPLLSTDRYPRLGLNQFPPTDITRVEKLADAVVKQGVKRVTTLVGDEDRFDSKREAPGWVNAIGRGDAAPLSALMINDGYVGTDRTRRASSAKGAAEVFRGLLMARGVEVGPAVEGAARNVPLIASIKSEPLSKVVGEMLATSDNNTAELLLKEIGKQAGTGGSTAAGLKVVRAKLTEWGIDLSGHELVDGSGLSESNRVSCATFVALLRREQKGSPIFDGMAVAGRSGTLSKYLEGTPADGVMRAKTGSLQLSRSLSGFFPAPDGSVMEFSFIVNGSRAKNRAENLWDDLARGLATYPQGPPLDGLGPAPVLVVDE